MKCDKLQVNQFYLDWFTISRDIQFYQLHEVGYFWRKSLDLVVAQAKFS